MTVDPSSRDPRVTPARPDLASSSLRGLVAAERFVDGLRHIVSADVLDLKRSPSPKAPLDTQLLHGEPVIVLEDKNGWAWVQAERDDYVGYVATSGLTSEEVPATHRIIVNRTFLYPAADMKTPVLAALPLGAAVAVLDQQGIFVKTTRGYVVASHCASNDVPVDDPVAIAGRLEGVPYLWGGKSPQGIDCSGLVQLAHALAGCAMPRDTDMQERLGKPLPFDERLTGLQRGDLVFWRGHVGIMVDPTILLHANAHHMLVSREPLVSARDRIAAVSGAPLTSIRRLELA